MDNYKTLNIPKGYAVLTERTKPGNKIIHTTMGTFKVRKNGRLHLAIDEGKNREFIRCTPVKSQDENL